MAQTLDKAVKIDVATIVHHGEKIILPEKMTVKAAIETLERRLKFLEEETAVHASYDVFPLDGAHALAQVLIQKYGWAPAEATPSFFGPKPPHLIDVAVDARGTTVQVPWGRFSLPGIDGWISTDVDMSGAAIKFAVQGVVKRKHDQEIKDLFQAIRDYLKTGSIYMGKATRIRFTDDEGEGLSMPEVKFIETEDINEDMLVFSERVAHSVETNLFTPITRVRELAANGIPVKRGILLGGIYGTGKSMAAKVASKLAVRAGVTFVYVGRANELARAIEFAKQYQMPACAVFCEDIDRATEGVRDAEMDDLLNIIDGIDSKSANVIVVLTTNNFDGINAAMLRPGRLDAVINVTPPDAKAVERLVRIYGGSAIQPGLDLHAVGQRLDGQIPAVVAEVVKRAKLSQLALQRPGEIVSKLSVEALLEAADTMQSQLELLRKNSAGKAPVDGFTKSLGKVVHDAINGRYADVVVAESNHSTTRAD